jgi:putative transposase
MRQNFIHNGKIINYPKMDKIIKRDYEDVYRALPAQTTQQILRLIEKDWKSFFNANREFKKNPEVFTGRPKPPNYKDKKDGLGIVIFTNQQCKIKNNFIHFPKAVGIDPIKTTVEKFNQVRIVPKFKHFVIEVVYEREPIKKEVNFKNVLGIDLGLNNLATLVSNQSDVNPILINGRPLKSINQFFNKTKAELMSFVGDKGSSNRIEKLSLKRECKMNDYMHKTSRLIIDYAVETQTGTIIVGENEGWKQKIKTGKKNNQNFVSVPLDRLKEMIAYKGEDYGIRVVFTEEAYTFKGQ